MIAVGCGYFGTTGYLFEIRQLERFGLSPAVA
jgi:hypothetical protein